MKFDEVLLQLKTFNSYEYLINLFILLNSSKLINFIKCFLLVIYRNFKNLYKNKFNVSRKVDSYQMYLSNDIFITCVVLFQ